MNRLTNQLTATIDQFIKSVNINWERKPLPGRWSNKQIIGHLCDSAKINLQCFVRCTYEENFKLTYEQDQWVATQHYQEMNIDDLLQLWRLLNLQITFVLDNYRAERLQVRRDNSKKEATLHTVEWLAQDYLEHLHHHLNQIRLT
jgi:hypothetical protein